MAKFTTFSVSIIFLQNALRRQLSITSFIPMSVAVLTCKSKILFLAKFKIMKLKIDAFSIFMKCSTKESMNKFFHRTIRR